MTFPNKNSRRPLKRRLLAPLIYLVAVLLLLEDWLWDLSAQALACLSTLSVVRKIEAHLARLSPYAALAAFLLPAGLLLPVKILALFSIAHGHTLLGLAIILAAKIGGAALTAWLYQLTRPALLSLAWFARWHGIFIRFKDRLIAQLRATSAWRHLQLIRHALRRRWRIWRAAFRRRLAYGKLFRLGRKINAQKHLRKQRLDE